VADLIRAQGDEICFTSGGTEASNHAIKGAVLARLASFWGRWAKGAHVVISAVEHPATTEPCDFLKRLGCKVTVVPVDGQGLVNPDDVRKALAQSTTLVSLMHSNNEVGTLMPVKEVAALTRERGVLLHVDAAQSLGKVPVDVNALGIDLLTVAGHKLYAPKGVGALYIRRGTKLERFMHGAGQENGQRAGTENVPYVVALGKACEIARQLLPQATTQMRKLRDRLWQRLQDGLGERVKLNGHLERRLPNTLNACFVGHIGSELLQKVPEIAASTGSACHEGKVTQSAVLCAMRVPPELGLGALRLTVGRFTTPDEIERAADILIAAARA
jgi:cysteine desulfurase